MHRKLFTSLLTHLPTCTILSLGLSVNAHAAPSVAVDIAPLHSLVSQVMENVGQPKLIIPAEASPHRYTMRPSEAKALADADTIFWMGESFTPWLNKAMNNVASSAQKIAVLDIEGTITHQYREGATFESHEHHEGHEDEGHEGEEHGKEEHHENEKHNEKEEHHAEEKHHEKEEHHDEHDAEGSDPHAWLDPENAKLWVNHIKDILSKQDPENASTYASNATKSIASLDALIESTRTRINAMNNPQFIVFHDAYQYFEKRFGITAAGSISLGDAQAPSPARIKEVRETVKKLGVTCAFTEPQYNPGLVNNVFEGTSVSTIGVMDPHGVGLVTGSSHYQKLIQNMANSLSQCQ
jgi:zinc transport system substrate-binding protein